MKILLVVATESEIIREKFNNFDILVTGFGMVNTSMNLTKELIKNDYELVINMGVAGAFAKGLEIGTVVEVVEDSFSEIGFEDGLRFKQFVNSELETKYIVQGKTDLQKVKGITVNTVHGNMDSIIKIVNRLNPDIESMEGAAIFKVCEVFGVDCIQIRSISNKVERRNKENWRLELAILNLNLEVEKILNIL